MKRFPPHLILIIATLVALVPFLNKAFHIDDPLFLWMARQITSHPLDPYGFTVIWASSPQPMWVCMQNPPLCSYFIALVASVAGWSEIALHTAFLSLSIAAVLGTFALARRFCGNPTTASLLTLFTPVFLVSATNVMCDVMLLALWVWSIECWLAGLERGKFWLFALSALLASAALLTKYFGVSLVPLLAIYTCFCKPARRWCVAFLLIPVLIAISYELVTRAAYGQGSFIGAMSYLVDVAVKTKRSVATQFLLGLSFTGGCLLSAMFLAPFRRRRSILLTAAVLLAAALSFHAFIPFDPNWAANKTLIWVEGTLFVTVGAGILALAVADLAQRRNAESLLLFMWVAGTFGFASFLNWSITARTVLPIAPAVAILVMRQLDRGEASVRLKWIGLLCAATISLTVTAADYRLASTARQASRHLRTNLRAEPGTVWFHGHWGFQYYMEQWGAKAIATDSKFASGDVMIIAENYPEVPSIPSERLRGKRLSFSTMPFAATFNRSAGAGFYSHVLGPIPWAVDRVPPETYYVARFR